MVKRKGKGQTESADGDDQEEGDKTPKPPVVLSFKNPAFAATRINANRGKSKGWKSLKQINATDKAHPGAGVTYAAVDAPPSRKPREKFSDLSGLPAKYTDPQTKLFYTDAAEFTQVRMLPPDVVTGYLELRKTNL